MRAALVEATVGSVQEATGLPGRTMVLVVIQHCAVAKAHVSVAVIASLRPQS